MAISDDEMEAARRHEESLAPWRAETEAKDIAWAQAGRNAKRELDEKAGLIPKSDSKAEDGKPASKEELNNRENRTGSAQSNANGSKGKSGGDSSSESTPTEGGRFSKLKGFGRKVIAKKNAKKAAVGVAVGGGVGGIIFGGMMMLAPLKLLSTMTNLQDEFFAPSNQASSKMGQQMLNHYIIRKVIPGMAAHGCNSTKVAKSCALIDNDSSLTGALWTAWHDSNLEGRMASEHGVEIQQRNGRFYVRAPGINGDLDLGHYNGATKTLDGQPFAKLNRSDARRVVMKSFNISTNFKELRRRHSVAKLMEHKYNIRRCGIAKPCLKTLDRLHDTIDMRKNALKLYITERYIMPRSEMVGTALTCALSDFNCADPGSSDNEGERKTQFQKDVLNQLLDYRRTYGEHPLADLDVEANKVREFGVTGYIVRHLAGEAVGKVVSTITKKVIPVLGWIDSLNSMYKSAAKAGPAFKHINYVISSTGAVNIAAMALTAVDGAKTGADVDTAAFGSVSAMFDEVPGGDQGGGAMEATPLYDQMNNGTTGQTASVYDLFSPQAYAAGSTNTPKVTAYTCEDKKLVPKGESVCPIMSFGVLGVVGSILNGISAVANNPALSPVKLLSGAWDATFGVVFNWIGNAVGGLASKIAGAVIPDWLMNQTVAWIQDHFIKPFLIDQMGDNPSGGRKYEIAAFGINVMAKDDAQFNEGGRVLSDDEARAIHVAMLEDRQAEFAAKPFYARLFDTQDSQSMVSRMALSLPTNRTSLMNRMGSMLSNPFGLISHSFSAMMPGQKANAAYYVPSPFHLPVYGYPLAGSGDPVADEIFADGFDPDVYWKAHNCEDPQLKQKWGDKATKIDENTTLPLQETLEPCMLIRDSISSGGGTANTDLLTPDPTAAGTTAGSTAPIGGTGAINMAEIFQPSDTLACPVGTDGGVQDGYHNGQLIKVRICVVHGVKVNARIASRIDAIFTGSAAAGINFGGGGFRTMAEQTALHAQKPGITSPPGYSNHQMGLAVDFSLNGASLSEGDVGFNWLNSNKAIHGLDWLRPNPYEPWHWSVDGN